MPDISKELSNIMNARYGKDVRKSIHDGLEKMNNEMILASYDVFVWRGEIRITEDTPDLAHIVQVGTYGNGSYVDFPDMPEGIQRNSFTLRNEESYSGGLVTQYIYTYPDMRNCWSRVVNINTKTAMSDWYNHRAYRYQDEKPDDNYSLPTIAFCGDSFTSTNYTGTDHEAISYVTYLNNMKVCNGVNYGISGASPYTWYNAHINDITNLFDIYFLSFGLNDDPSGNGDSDSNDPKTFGGGLNRIIDKIYETSPTSRIIIWCMDGWYSNTKSAIAKEIAEKKACEYYSMKEDPKIPLRIGGKFDGVLPGLSDEIVSKKNEVFQVSSVNQHPNSAAQKFLATYLKSIF